LCSGWLELLAELDTRLQASFAGDKFAGEGSSSSKAAKKRAKKKKKKDRKGKETPAADEREEKGQGFDY
jgi:hypothetical protein